MEVQTFRPTYQPKPERKRPTNASPSGETLDYQRMRVRTDLLTRFDAMKPDEKSLTASLNIAVVFFWRLAKHL